MECNAPIVSVVIPCHNEEESIAAVVRAAHHAGTEVIVVDNNSTDHTAPRARAEGARVVSEKTPGYGAALKTGCAAARGDIIVTLDGDGQYPAYDIPRLVAVLGEEGYDFLNTSRFPLSDKRSMSLVRRAGNRLLTALTNTLFGISLRDSQSGMWVFRRTILDRIPLQSDGMSFSEEIKIRSFCHGSLRCGEVHIRYAARSGASKLSVLRDGIANACYLFSLRRSLPVVSYTKNHN